VAIGSSAPELLVSVSAALSGSSDIALGNVIGSNIANIGLILGLSGLIYPISVHVTLLRREIPIMIMIAFAAYVLLSDGTVSRTDGLMLLAAMVAFLTFVVLSARKEQKIKHNIPEDEEDAQFNPQSINRARELGRVGLGIVVLMIGAQFTVDNATNIARAIGISELVIGVTLVAVGTSLPELVTSVMAALKRESDIAIGNVVGSNIFNIVAILGTTAAIQPMNVQPQIIAFDGWVMIGFSLLVLPFALNRKLERLEAFAFLGAYVAYVAYTVIASL
jgi:cation:H+ antiporter